MFVDCCVPGCTNNSSKQAKRWITFHEFPETVELLEKWRTAIKVESSFFMENFHLAICSEHFKKSDFEKSEQVLKLDAIPSLRLPPSYIENKLRPIRPKVCSRFHCRETNISWNGLQNSLTGEKRNWIQGSPSSNDNSKRICHETSELQEPIFTRHFIILPGQMEMEGIINQPNQYPQIPQAVDFSDPLTQLSHNYMQVCMDTPVVFSEQEQPEQPSTKSHYYTQICMDTPVVSSEQEQAVSIRQEQPEQPSTNSHHYTQICMDTPVVFSEQEQAVSIRQEHPEQPSTNSHYYTQICMDTPVVFSEQEQPEQPSTLIKKEIICPETDENGNSPNQITASEKSEFTATKIKVEPLSEDYLNYETSNQDIGNTERPEQLFIVIKSENLLCFETLEKESCHVETVCVLDETEENESEFLESKTEIEDGPLEITENDSVERIVDIKYESESLEIDNSLNMDFNQMDPKPETDEIKLEECVSENPMISDRLLPQVSDFCRVRRIFSRPIKPASPFLGFPT